MRDRKVFYGWWVVGAFSVTTFMSTGVRHAVGPFLKPIVADLNLDLVQEVRNTWQFYRDRRPEMYSDIVAA